MGRLMEEWEIEYRKYLEDTLENKPYDISSEGPDGRSIKAYTGKGGQIEILVAIRKGIKNT